MLTLFLLFSFIFPNQNLKENDSVPKSIQEFWFWNQYDLPRNAATKSTEGNVFLKDFQVYQTPISENGNGLNQPVSAVYQLFEDKNTDYSKPFALEFLLLNHVNNPVGISWEFIKEDQLGLCLSIFDKKMNLGTVKDSDWIGTSHQTKPFKKYWSHVVLNFDGSKLSIYENGDPVLQQQIGNQLQGNQLILKSYVGNEPYMQAHDLLKKTALYATSLSAAEIKASFQNSLVQIESGKLYPEDFHLIAGPYLSHIQANFSLLVWETDRSAKATIKYGEQLPLEKIKVVSSNSKNINSALIEGLKTGTTYYYQIELESEKGEKILTPVLTFQTVKPKGSPFLFGIISDTESRPQINNQVAQRLWEERPDFLIHLGDLTDGGWKESKFEWTMEYFQGVGALTARIPIATVPGNGDGDLHWYRQYHPHVGEKGFYRFDYGEASFFMLNSNPRKDLQKGGEQYVWLENEMSKSEAKWKFVVLHHAPYSGDEDDYGNTWKEPGNQGDPQLKDLISLVEAKEVDMVFFGHLHTYMRSHPLEGDKVAFEKGTVYVQAGGAGGNLEDNAPTRTWFTAKNYRGHHYCTVQIVNNKLELRTYNLEGGLIDSFQMKK
jgi:predicted phosphodiesterase